MFSIQTKKVHSDPAVIVFPNYENAISKIYIPSLLNHLYSHFNNQHKENAISYPIT